MRITALFVTVCAVAVAAIAAVTYPRAAAASATGCGSGSNGSAGYAYAGHQSSVTSHGVRATITPTMRPSIATGHVAGWIGVGGPKQGPNGETMWLQTGVAGIPGLGLVVYAEITRPGADPQFVSLVDHVEPGQSFRLAVLEISKRPNHWRIWLNGRPMTAPIHLPGSAMRWKPIATGESFNGSSNSCNAFAFRFERVGVAGAMGGSWKTFVPGYKFLDRGYVLRQLRPSTPGQRTLAGGAVQPYAFEAGSAAAL
jgi:hypothetical protein